MLMGGGWEPPPSSGSLVDQVPDEDYEPSYLIDGLMIDDGILLINAQFKAGKTTLVSVNLAADLALGSSFLRQYPIYFNRNVTVWNLEVSQAQLMGWLVSRLGKEGVQRAKDRLFVEHYRGHTFDLFNDEVAAWVVNQLKSRNTGVWIIDPLSKLYAGEERDNSEFNRWWKRVEQIKRDAGVDVIIFAHHTGHGTTGNGDAMPRARGASSMMGNADVIWSFRHDGDLGDKPKGTRRYLEGFGRDVEFDELALNMPDLTTKRLVAVKGDRYGDAAMAKHKGRAERLARVVETSPGIAQAEAFTRAGFSSKSISRPEVVQAAIDFKLIDVRGSGVKGSPLRLWPYGKAPSA